MRKLRKLIKTPGLFFRDYFNNRYPIINSEQLCPEKYESILIQQTEKLEKNLIHEQNPIVVDHNELYYSLKSVRDFMPWVRRVFIITNNKIDIPEYLKKDDIQVVLHSDIISAEYLPTFNSHVIEAHIHNVPDLSENFIYFNDDVFVARPLSQAHFFQDNGLASLFVADKYLDRLYAKGNHTPTLLASLYSQKLLKRDFEVKPNQMLVHTYVPLRKTYFKLAWEHYETEIKGFLKHRFRSNFDLNLATFLVPWLMYLKGQSASHVEVCYYFNIRSPHAAQQYRKLLGKGFSSPHSFCANDFCSIDNFIKNKEYMEEFGAFLNKYFRQ